MARRARLARLPAAFLALAASCGCSDPARGAASAPPSVPIAPLAASGALEMRTVRESGAIKAVTGERLDLVVTRPVGIPERLQVEWPSAPAIEGDAVRFVRRRVEAPPPEDDGGVTTLHYELEAARPGAACVTLTPRPASPDAAQPPVVLDVTVRAAAPR